jgi:phosphate-selective porin OprO/OprP
VGNASQLELAGRLATTWWWDEATDGRGYGHFAVAGSYGEPNGLDANNQSRYRTRPEARSSNRWIDTGTIAGASKFALAAVEGVLNLGPTQLVGEYQYVDVDRINAFGSNLHFHGGYVYASYFLTGEHMPWDRESGTLGRVKPFENFFAVCDCEGFRQRGLGAWQIAARYSYGDFTDENIIGGVGESCTLGLNWYWNPYARMQFNYLIGEVDRGQAGGDDYQIAGMRFMIDF